MWDTLTHWWQGRYGQTGRVIFALAPVIVFFAYFFGGLVVYAIRNRRYGKHHDPEIESRGESAILGMRLRVYFVWMLKPLWNLVVRTGIPASALTTLSVLLAVFSGFALAGGRFALGGWLYIFAGICDLMDGRLARATGQVSKKGAALDSILDRYSDSAVLAGLAWYYRESWVLLAALLAIIGSTMVSYVRARGEGLGVQVKVGMMQRPERIMYLGMFNVFSPIIQAFVDPYESHPAHHLTIVGLVLLAITTQFTAIRRLSYLLGVLGGDTLRQWLRSDLGRTFRTVFAATVATVVDITLVMYLVESHQTSPWMATAIGCGVGAVISYILNRILLGGKTRSTFFLLSRFTFVSLTSVMLNAGGVAIFMLIPDMDYRLGWIIMRCAVFVFWNYPLHRSYVFAPHIGKADQEQAPVT